MRTVAQSVLMHKHTVGRRPPGGVIVTAATAQSALDNPHADPPFGAVAQLWTIIVVSMQICLICAVI